MKTLVKNWKETQIRIFDVLATITTLSFIVKKFFLSKQVRHGWSHVQYKVKLNKRLKNQSTIRYNSNLIDIKEDLPILADKESNKLDES